jgi:ABC-type sugar transport system ATPase subunit
VISLSLRKLTKKFGAIAAVDQANLDVNAGEFMVIVGESGCGKATTLRLIAGLELPDSGTIFIGGVPVNDVPVGKRNVRYFRTCPVAHAKVFEE